MDLRRILYSDSESEDEEYENHPINNENMETYEDSETICGIDKDISCWVFGYGSLCWNPGFTFSKCLTGYIRGYVRRFFQGSIIHRGTPNKPGRVATLIPDKEGITWGCAYKVTGNTALEYLKQRECTLGGYVTLEAKFFPRIATCDTEFYGETFPVLIYVATDKNSLWLGESAVENIAKDVCESEGSSGHNVEYVLRLAEFMRDEIPDEHDEHLFNLEFHILENLARKNIPLHTVMGIPPEKIRRDSHSGRHRRPTTFEYAARVPDKKLRCLNV